MKSFDVFLDTMVVYARSIRSLHEVLDSMSA